MKSKFVCRSSVRGIDYLKLFNDFFIEILVVYPDQYALEVYDSYDKPQPNYFTPLLHHLSQWFSQKVLFCGISWNFFVKHSLKVVCEESKPVIRLSLSDLERLSSSSFKLKVFTDIFQILIVNWVSWPIRLDGFFYLYNILNFFFFACFLVVGPGHKKSDVTLVPRHSQIYATRPRRNGKDWSAIANLKSVGDAFRGNVRCRGGLTLWGIPVDNSTSQKNFNRHFWLATVPEAGNHVSPHPPMTAAPYQDYAFEGSFSCAACDSCWDNWTKSTTNQTHVNSQKGLFVRTVRKLICSWHNRGGATESNWRVGNFFVDFQEWKWFKSQSEWHIRLASLTSRW